MTAREMYDMKLNDIIRPENSPWIITRVLGGWIYSHGNFTSLPSVFVPLDNEFINREWREF